MGSIPGWGRSPGEGNGNPLQYSCLENPMEKGAWWATVYGVVESDTTEATQHTLNSLSVQKNHHTKIVPTGEFAHPSTDSKHQ